MKQFDIYMSVLDPTRGAEIKKTRPAIIVSPDSMNSMLRTVIVAPMTSAQKGWPFRVLLQFGGRSGSIALDQIRVLDKNRLLRHLGVLDAVTANLVSKKLVEIFELSP